MSKLPKGTPERGERCCIRGRVHVTGTLVKYNPESNWATVEWDEGMTGPKLIHRFELMKLKEENENV